MYTKVHDPPSVPHRAASTARWYVHESDTTRRLYHTEPVVILRHVEVWPTRSGGRHDHEITWPKSRGCRHYHDNVYLHVTFDHVEINIIMVMSTSTWPVTWSETNRGRLWTMSTFFRPIRSWDFSRRYDKIINNPNFMLYLHYSRGSVRQIHFNSTYLTYPKTKFIAVVNFLNR